MPSLDIRETTAGSLPVTIVCASACMRSRACVRACVRACMCVCVCVCVSVLYFVSSSIRCIIVLASFAVVRYLIRLCCVAVAVLGSVSANVLC